MGVRDFRVCILKCLCVCACACVCVGARACARARSSVHARVCVCSCTSDGKYVRACASSTCLRACVCVCVCVRNECMRASRRCARALAAQRGLIAVFIDRPVPRRRPRVPSVRLVPSAGVARRCDMETRDRQRAVGCASWAHDRDRRLRRHLRHRRPLWRHQLPGRVGEHRRRCASRTRSREWSVGYSRGYSRGI